MPHINYYPTAEIELNGKKLKIEAYRVAEIREYVLPLDMIQSKLSKYISQVDLYMDGDKLTLDEIDKLTEITDKVVLLKADAMDISFKIAQLGLKRAVYPEAYDKIGSELDEFEDIGITESMIQKVSGMMMKLAKQDMPQVADTKNDLKERLQKNSGRDI